MEYELDSMIGLDKLELYYEAHMIGIDGECFSYSIYFEDELNNKKFEDVNKAVEEFIKNYDDKDTYLGYINVSKVEDKVSIYLDLGNVNPNDESTAIQGILKAINNVPGIKRVVINEDCDFC